LTTSPRRAAFIASMVFGVGDERLERQRIVLGDTDHHQAKRIGHGQLHRRQHRSGLFFDPLVDSGTNH
jgi:hypothetical protein